MHVIVCYIVIIFYFFLECLVDTLRSCEIGSHHDALVYTAGAVKHLSSNNPTAQKELVSLECIEGLAQILDAISKDVSMYMALLITISSTRLKSAYKSGSLSGWHLTPVSIA